MKKKIGIQLGLVVGLLILAVGIYFWTGSTQEEVVLESNQLMKYEGDGQYYLCFHGMGQDGPDSIIGIEIDREAYIFFQRAQGPVRLTIQYNTRWDLGYRLLDYCLAG